ATETTVAPGSKRPKGNWVGPVLRPRILVAGTGTCLGTCFTPAGRPLDPQRLLARSAGPISGRRLACGRSGRRAPPDLPMVVGAATARRRSLHPCDPPECSCPRWHSELGR